MRYLNAKGLSALPIGRLGENEATIVVFDISEWRELYGNGTFSLVNLRPGGAAAYPCVIEQDATTVKWTVKNADLAKQGYGKCELIYTVGGTIAKSEIYTTFIGEALTGGGDVPEPWEDWVQRVIEAGTQAETSAASALADANRAESSATEAEQSAQAAQAAQEAAEEAKEEWENMTASAVQLPADEQPTAEYKDGHLTIGIPEIPIASEETLGGIKAGSDFDISVDGTLSIYKTLTLSASVSPSSAEMGSTIDEVTVSWTLNKTPVSQSVEGVDVPVSARSRALTDLGITDNRTFNVTAADARMSLTRNPGITFYRHVYSKVGSPDAAPTQASECVKQSDLSTFGNNGADFNYTVGSTLWLLTTKANAKIETNVLGQWADVTTIYGGTVEFTQANGAVVTYHAYNTGTFSGTGSAKYRIR